MATTANQVSAQTSNEINRRLRCQMEGEARLNRCGGAVAAVARSTPSLSAEQTGFCSRTH
ncbi:hypothetical protein ACCS91_22505 [Rhizobium ruizarguesonis]|jgi:hypothetical protein|uniref:hypothetical protein n=1 Tax=Rhizobium ruizarguesonis TaxID=2081791 RepID=UPI0010311616|nr:hypothetical protein [Rhizobium ruizarguesonis]NEH34940.1 hypothetical protein [Rhizobium ruizarguesonis]NEI78764.1 hypothetical protein [Rhizobium ruizarguesonis]TAW77238.1 hypothetical protein ELI10_08470 [Rhizobium ruizarguesonis]TAX14202.1 hypothetical protein ELI09_08530 [Rhizobium ruizarguesonis]TAX19035.1 hypothetical protein ELI08_08530 [Rhizobium ruizarguesonis]